MIDKSVTRVCRLCIGRREQGVPMSKRSTLWTIVAALLFAGWAWMARPGLSEPETRRLAAQMLAEFAAESPTKVRRLKLIRDHAHGWPSFSLIHDPILLIQEYRDELPPHEQIELYVCAYESSLTLWDMKIRRRISTRTYWREKGHWERRQGVAYTSDYSPANDSYQAK